MDAENYIKSKGIDPQGTAYIWDSQELKRLAEMKDGKLMYRIHTKD